VLRERGVTIKVEPKNRNALWPNLLSTMLPFFLLMRFAEGTAAPDEHPPAS